MRLHDIVLFSILKFVPNDFCFQLLLKHADCFEKLVNMLHYKIRVNDGFKVSDVVISVLQTRDGGNRLRDMKMQNCKHCWTKTTHKHKINSAEQLSVSQQAVFNRLREMGKIQNVGRWVSHELNERQMERHQTPVKF